MRDGRPTILQIIPRLDTGGAELATIEITDAVVKAGGRVIVATEGGRLEARIATAGGEIFRMAAGSKNPLTLRRNADLLSRLIVTEDVDLVHARSRAPAWSALLAARHTKRPFVTTYHGAYAEKGPMKRLYNSVMARGDVVIANSEWTGRLIRQRYNTPDFRIAVIPRGVDIARFDTAAIESDRIAALRRDWGVPDGAPIVLHAARLTGWKGQRVVVEAAGLLAREGRLGETSVILAGDEQGRQDYRRALEQLIATQGLNGRVRLVGHVEDVAAAYAAAHVTVVASTEPEAFGRAAAEALAVGCPVIATDIGAPPETLRAASRVAGASRTGWLVPPGDGPALADALAEALALDPAERGEMGRRASQDIRARFTLSGMKRRTLAVYDSLLNTHLAEAFDRQL